MTPDDSAAQTTWRTVIRPRTQYVVECLDCGVHVGSFDEFHQAEAHRDEHWREHEDGLWTT